MEDNFSRVYILLDSNNNIIRIEGEYTLPSDLTDWVLIEQGEPCDRLNLAQTHYLDKPLFEDHGIPRYQYIEGSIVERSEDDINADIAMLPMPEDTESEKISELEESLELLDETAIELYEYSLAQEAINGAQDEALIEIYEILGGINL